MEPDYLLKLFEHNNWANLQMIEACAALSDAQLDAEPSSATKGSIRQTLIHLVSSQRGYLALLTLPVEQRPTGPVAFAGLQASARASGDSLLELIRGLASNPLPPRLQTTDGYSVEPWVVIVQIINHATDHREQINSMRSALGLAPLEQDGWSFGDVTRAVVPKAKG